MNKMTREIWESLQLRGPKAVVFIHTQSLKLLINPYVQFYVVTHSFCHGTHRVAATIQLN